MLLSHIDVSLSLPLSLEAMNKCPQVRIKKISRISENYLPKSHNFSKFQNEILNQV